MRLASCIAAALFAAAWPAFATSTIVCRSTVSPGDGPELSLTVGNGEGIGVVHARFALGGTSLITGQGAGAPAISQSWLDEHSLRVDIVDANAERRLVRLDTRRRGTDYLGILIHQGRTWRVRCDEEG
jgi:hypothetical protein